MIIAFSLLLLTMFAALISEIKTYDDCIHPYIWVASGIAGFLFNLLGFGIVYWIESIVVTIILFIVLLLLYSKLSDSIGGGVLKGFLVIGIVLGRYSLLTIINFIIICVIAILIEKGLCYWRGQMYYGALFLFIATLITWGEYYFFLSGGIN